MERGNMCATMHRQRNSKCCIAVLVLITFCLMKSCFTLLQTEMIVESFLHLKVLFLKVIINYVNLIFMCKIANNLNIPIVNYLIKFMFGLSKTTKQIASFFFLHCMQFKAKFQIMFLEKIMEDFQT